MGLVHARLPGTPDLGDRLVEKLAEQRHHMEAKIGNMTCVMRELNVLDASNNIDIQAMKRDIQKYTMPSEWFKTKYEHLLDTCYEMATNLPAEIAENSVITGETFGTVKLGEVKMFTKCCEKAKTKLCMHQDIKNKVESNFGPMEDILQETQLTEHEFFPLVMQTPSFLDLPLHANCLAVLPPLELDAGDCSLGCRVLEVRLQSGASDAAGDGRVVDIVK